MRFAPTQKRPLVKPALAAALLGLLTFAPSQAFAEAPRTMLVLDGSGSMWGQISGKTKIEIARDVVTRVLDRTPNDRELGLVAYGHSREGDCSDIAQLAEIGSDRSAIRAEVQSLNPKGKTPLSDAVVFAADRLSWRTTPATVVLVSDGIENCHADPCAVGAALEAAGADFTVHVVGFDIDDPKAISQLQCMAESTGGSFFPADNADDLSLALEQTVVEAAPAPPPPPQPSGVLLRATELDGGPEIEEGLSWKVVRDANTAETLSFGPGGVVETELPPGVYDISVERAETGQRAEALRVAIPPGGTEIVTIVFDLDLSASLRLEPAGTAAVSSDVLVHWEGPDREGDYITIVPEGARPGVYRQYEYTREGSPVSLRMPPETGAYEVRYMLGRPSRVLASAPLTLTDVAATLDAPATIPAGQSFDVAWTGPGQQGDWITVIEQDKRETAYASYSYPRTNPVSLTAALAPGEYEIRYVLAGKRVIARRPITVTPITASLDAPETVPAGAAFNVDWQGPAEKGDWVTIVAPDARDTSYKSYFYTARKESPGELKAPLEAGEYELRFLQGGKKIVARRPIQVSAVAASVNAPDTAEVGQRIAVAWTGPDTKNDYVIVMKDGEPVSGSGAYFYTKNGTPGALIMPIEPGGYELVYLQKGKQALARRPITVTDVEATLSAPAEIEAGAEFSVAWTGPDAKNDLVSIAAPDAAASDLFDYAYTQRGSPASIMAPLDAGQYELRYVLRGKRVIARRPITVTDATATLTAPETAAAGSELTVDWSGPGARRDLVTLAEPGQEPHRYFSYKYARSGSPSRLKTPDAPGEYELRYVLGGKKVIATRPITITD